AELLEERDGLLEIRSGLEQDLLNLQTEFDRAREAADARIGQLNEHLTALNQTREVQAASQSAAQARISELETRLEELETAATDAVAKVQQAAEEKAALELELNQMLETNETLQQEALQLQQELQSRQEELQVLQSDKQSLSATWNDLEERATKA